MGIIKKTIIMYPYPHIDRGSNRLLEAGCQISNIYVLLKLSA